MASRREEKERLRQQRIAAQRREAQSGQRRLVLGYTVAGLLAAAVVVGIIVVIASGSSDGGSCTGDLPAEAARRHPRRIRGHVRGRARRSRGDRASCGRAGAARRRPQGWPTAICDSISLTRETSTFRPTSRPQSTTTNPPTSGDHDPVSAGGWRVRRGTPDPPPLRRTRSSTGGSRSSTAPISPRRTSSRSRGCSTRTRRGCCSFRTPTCHTTVAATAWTNMLGCDRYEGAATLDAIRAFRDTLRGQGPQPVPL